MLTMLPLSEMKHEDTARNTIHNSFLVYFVNLYMFRAYLGPSSGGTTVCIQTWMDPGQQTIT